MTDQQPFACDLDGFKQMTKEFLQAIENETDLEALDQARACLNLHYLSLVEKEPADSYIAVSYLKFAFRAYMKREFALMMVRDATIVNNVTGNE